MRRRLTRALTLAATAAGVVLWRADPLLRMVGHVHAARSVDDRLAEFGAAAEARLAPRVRAAGVTWPPRRAVLLALKAERRLELHAGDAQGPLRPVCAWPVIGASGGPGPKLREGDRQVPEGIYRVEALNPNSAFHVSLRLDYPNADDRRRGAEDGRDRLGGDIMIHGSDASVGCLAMGDAVAEELFLLAARCGLDALTVVIAPNDPRTDPLVPPAGAPTWTVERYAQIADAARGLERIE